jgi:hypothetical protein
MTKYEQRLLRELREHNEEVSRMLGRVDRPTLEVETLTAIRNQLRQAYENTSELIGLITERSYK